MTKVICTFYNKEKKYIINESNIVYLRIKCQDSAIIKIVDINIDINLFVNCKIAINSEIIFDGQITEVIDDGLISTYTLKLFTSNIEHYVDDSDDELIKKFKQENPDLFQRELYISDKEPIRNIEQWIIKDTLKTKIDKSLPISELNLHIKASWLRCVHGQIDLTNKLKFALSGKQLETFTPNKLTHSWFKTFDLLRTDSSTRQTKYFISRSKLTEENTTSVTFNDKFTLNRTSFNFELSLGWEYEQLESEEIKCKIINNNVQKCNSEDIIIDLHNVQEYLCDAYQQSFFKTDTGQKIGNIILNEIIKYIKNSMYNLYVQFCLPICSKTPNLSFHQPIAFNNTVLYVRELEYVYDATGSYINVTCIGSQYKITNNKDIFLKLSDDVNKITGCGDVIDKIIVQNDADTQFQKLHRYFDNTKDKTHESLKKEINAILDKYQTKIIIKTKPLKTNYINKTVHDAIPIVI